jgi:hypothetical protein
MRCPNCRTELQRANFTLTSGDDSKRVMPSNWFEGNILFECPKCATEPEKPIYNVLLKDGSVYQYVGDDQLWHKVKLTVRKMPKEKIIGGAWVQ